MYLGYENSVAKLSKLVLSFIKTITRQIATLPTRSIRFLEFAITTLKPPRYRTIDLNTLIQSVVHSYHSDITEPNTFPYQVLSERNNSFENIHIDFYDFPLINNTICKVKPSQKSDSRVFSILPYCEKNLQFLNKNQFQYFGPNDSEAIKTFRKLIESKNCYATHCYNVGKLYTPLWNGLKPVATLQTKRPIKVHIQYREKLKASLDDL